MVHWVCFAVDWQPLIGYSLPLVLRQPTNQHLDNIWVLESDVCSFTGVVVDVVEVHANLWSGRVELEVRIVQAALGTIAADRHDEEGTWIYLINENPSAKYLGLKKVETSYLENHNRTFCKAI